MGISTLNGFDRRQTHNAVTFGYHMAHHTQQGQDGSCEMIARENLHHTSVHFITHSVGEWREKGQQANRLQLVIAMAFQHTHAINNNFNIWLDAAIILIMTFYK